MSQEKTCNLCKIPKKLGEFNKHSGRKDGYNERCRVCSRDVQRKYRRVSLEKTRQQNRESYQRCKARVARYGQDYRKSNKESISQRMRQYLQQNKAEYAARDATRRARKLEATPTWSDPIKIKHVYWVCNFISELTGVKHHVDHIHPLQGKTICGLHVHTNLQILTAKENRAKGNKFC